MSLTRAVFCFRLAMHGMLFNEHVLGHLESNRWTITAFTTAKSATATTVTGMRISPSPSPGPNPSSRPGPTCRSSFL